MTKPAVLVTGGGGYIGSHAVLALLDAGYPVTVIDNLVTGFRWAIDPRAAFVQGSVADEALVRETLRRDKIAAIMHFAGSVVVPELDRRSAQVLPEQHRRLALPDRERGGVRGPALHFSSTAATYRNPQEARVTEATPTVPINPYGRSKLMTEQMLADAPRSMRSISAPCAIPTSPAQTPRAGQASPRWARPT